MNRKYISSVIFCAFATLASAQSHEQQHDNHNVTVSGSVQSDMLFPQQDAEIGTEKTNHWALTNTYLDLRVAGKEVEAGARFEFLRFPLPGFEHDFKGYGVPNFYLKMHNEHVEVTLGTVYEQFGSGFILRNYEERSLGIDNSLLGAKVVARPFQGVSVKAVGGKQRRYWDWNNSFVSGADIELSLDQWIKGLANGETYITLGGSFVNKYEKQEDVMVDATHKLNLPSSVNAWDVRLHLQTHGLNLLAEYAEKGQDPSFDNGYIYKKGNVAMLSASYSQKGFSVLAQAKRSDNMSFRSKRSMTGASSFINHLPAFTQDQTYALAALYPYATRPNGEWAYQGEVAYTFPKKTALGGRYGTGVKVNFSHVRAIERNYINGGAMGTDGYQSPFFQQGDERYYQDLNVQLDKKFSKSFHLHLMYMNQYYNKTIVEGHGGMIKSNIFIADAKYRFSKKITLRGEAQYLNTKDDEGDWWYGLLELSILPGWMITVSDMYHAGETKLHYYQGLVTYNFGSHRIQAGYGRTRAGYNCAGGVCRYVPASKGFTLSYNYNF